ncbi:MAG: type IV pilus twitching motility protein PilT [Phycisphaerales bacterium]|jgi:twitching motility protein PilT|nr:PilT/PilU family type 4a pilus ATPase [Phycisphaeraceae bacterium]
MLPGTMNITKLLAGMKKLGASDLHIKVGYPPTFRVNGLLRPVQTDPMTADEAEHFLDGIVPEKIKGRFEATGDLDFAAFVDGDRFRVNMFRAGGGVNAAIRRVKAEIPTFESLGLPKVYKDLSDTTGEGLVLVVGVTGSGKSTTLAAMIEHINATRAEHIITVEDPVEYRFVPQKSIVSQREIGIDVTDYKAALRYVVRQDPDVVFIGELRDHDTVLAAIQAAETGHLVFGSMHTADTSQSFSRILEFFPTSEHTFLRSALASSLRAICAQRLLPGVGEMNEGKGGMVPATEVLLNSPIVQQKIRQGEDEDFPAIINASRSEGMRSFTYSLSELVKQDRVSLRVAMEYAPNREALDAMIKGVEVRAQTLVGKIRS